MSDENTKSSHLDALRIDRGRQAGRPARRFLIPALSVVVIVGAAIAAFYLWQSDPGIPVHVVTVETDTTGSGSSGLDATGYVVARRQATLSAKILGKLVYLDAEEGERIEQGQVVARLDDSNYAAALQLAKAQEQQAKAAFDDATLFYERYENLLKQNAVSMDAFDTQKAAYDSARAAYNVAQATEKYAQTNEDDTTVRAPFSGVVTNKVAQVGDIVAPSAAGGGDTFTGIATIVDMDSLEVEVDVSENYIDRVHAGGQATVVLDAYPDWEIPASVIAVIPTADQTKGTVKVRIGIKVKDTRILPEMGARVSFLTNAQPASETVSHGVIVPLEAVQISGGTGTVFVIGQDNIVEKRAVRLGVKTSKSVSILSGVSPGDQVVTGDFSKLRDGTKVTILE